MDKGAKRPAPSPPGALSPKTPPNVVAELNRLKQTEGDAEPALARAKRELSKYELKVTQLGASREYIRNATESNRARIAELQRAAEDAKRRRLDFESHARAQYGTAVTE
jgi:chromosome segregation ATPase